MRSHAISAYLGRSRHISQEDAEEWLTYVLDRLHEELLSLAGSGSRPEKLAETADGGEWLSVGRSSRVMSTRTVVSSISPVSAVFGGQLQSKVDYD